MQKKSPPTKTTGTTKATATVSSKAGSTQKDNKNQKTAAAKGSKPQKSSEKIQDTQKQPPNNEKAQQIQIQSIQQQTAEMNLNLNKDSVQMPIQVQNQIIKDENEEQKSETGDITVIFSNYKDKFQIKNGQIDSFIIDDQYAINFAYVGNYKLNLKLGNAIIKQKSIGDAKMFTDLKVGEVYTLIIDEDQEEENKRGGSAYTYLTDKASEVNQKRVEGCSCLFGNPCVDKYICKDWNNREKVAKANGWKGFS